MKQYIDKSVIISEIEKWQDEIMKGIFSFPLTGSDKTFATFEYKILVKIMDFIDTLKVNEVDLEEEMNKYFDDNFYITETWGIFSEKTENEINRNDLEDIAEHFFELGLKAQKGE